MYNVAKLVTRVTERVHCARLIKYAAELDGQVEPTRIVELTDRTEAKYGVLDAIVDVSGNSKGFWFRLR